MQWSLEATTLIIPLPAFYLYWVGTLKGVFWSCLILTEISATWKVHEPGPSRPGHHLVEVVQTNKSLITLQNEHKLFITPKIAETKWTEVKQISAKWHRLFRASSTFHANAPDIIIPWKCQGFVASPWEVKY